MADPAPGGTPPAATPPATGGDKGGAPPPAADPKAPPATVLGGGADSQPAGDPAPYWKDDWRNRLAGEDTQALGMLTRFQTPEAMWNSYRAMEKQLSSGQLKPVYRDDMTDAEKQAYRKAHGVPDKAEAYGVDLPKIDGYEHTEADKQDLQAFLKVMHDGNAPKNMVASALNAYWGIRQKGMEQLAQAAQEATIARKAEIQAEWGKDWKSTARMAANDVIKVLGDDKAKGLIELVLDDGTRLGDHPDFLRYVANAARRTQDDEGYAVAAATITGGKTAQDEFNELTDLMWTDRRKWESKPIQDRLQQLSLVMSRQQGGNKAA